jgi:hypothetical protein
MTEQMSLPWPPRCDGSGNVYFVRQTGLPARYAAALDQSACLSKRSPDVTIVTTRPRKRRPKPAQAATIKLPRIVQHTPKGRAWKLPDPDPRRGLSRS